jgi:hypothetical protein
VAAYPVPPSAGPAGEGSPGWLRSPSQGPAPGGGLVLAWTVNLSTRTAASPGRRGIESQSVTVSAAFLPAQIDGQMAVGRS